MLRGWLKHLTLFIFLVSILLIVYLQFNSGQSIDNLIHLNARLLNELKTQTELQKLETGVVSVESNIRGAVIADRLDHIKNLENHIREIRKSVNRIDIYFNDPSTDSIVKRLDTLVERKLRHNYNILSLVYSNNKDSAESLVNTYRGKLLTDSIVKNINLLDSTRQVLVSSITANIGRNGRNARIRGMFLAVLAGISSMLAFWYIIAISRRRQKLIGILDASEKKVKEAALVKEQFLANMSHEIRTPMNAIIGFTNLLEKSHLDNLQKEHVEHIQSSGKSLLAIVNDILDLSKIEAGMLRVEEEPFNLSSLLQSMEIMFSKKAQQKNIDLVINKSEDTPVTLTGDAMRLNQVLINLLGNAIKFTTEGAVSLQVSVIKRSEKKIRLRFTVSDTGIGISPKEQGSIFERFRQAEPSTTRRFGGTGLGLSIVKQLVQLLDGSISVQSEKNKGSIFSVELPFGLAVETDRLPGIEINSEIQNPVTIINAKILVAEDNPVNQALISHLLQLRQVDFLIVHNGMQAVEEMKNAAYDLVLMDMQMPEMDGYTATKLIRNKLNSTVPIIAMTANAMPGEREKCISYGMNDYISKPINEAELFKTISLFTANSKTNFVDLQYLKELSNGDLEFEKKMIAQFLAQAPQDLSALQTAITSGNADQIKFLSHSLKSSVGYVGLSEKIYPLLENLEINATLLPTEKLMEKFEAIEKICKGAIEEIGEQ
ncbi:MAG TPA: ATP-binding protein [Chitinophagaceae bacterium]|jgi:Signal transduction histidine kinase